MTTPEESDKFQQWEMLCGHQAWHLIERHADNWGEIDLMMNSWLKAKSADALDAKDCVLREIAEEWAGAECGEPVTAQEAYAIELAKRMYRLAIEGLK